MAETEAFQSWINGDDATWDSVILGNVFLPGVCTIDDFEYGQDIDIQKRRKKEKCRIRDNGLAPCSFNIKIEITAAEWPQWIEVLPAIQPRREGGSRSPLQIIHPLPNSHGVRDIYVHKIKVEPPSARAGMVITIKVAEWFEEDKDTAKPKVMRDSKGGEVFFRGHPKYERPSYFGDPKQLANTLQSNQGLPVSDYANVMANSFEKDPPAPSPNPPGWQGYRQPDNRRYNRK